MARMTVIALVAAGALALLSPAEAYATAGAARVVRSAVRARSAFVAMSDEPAVVEAGELEVSTDEARSLTKTRTNKRKRSDRAEPTVKLSELEVGSTVTGVVRNVVAYGAFVDIGAPKDGMLHVSDISNSFVANITDVLKVGEEITARVKSVDAEAGRFALIMKEDGPVREARPARRESGSRGKTDLSAMANFDEKVMMRGKVVSVMDFGAFVSIGDKMDGLVHISQLQEARTNAVTDVVTIGQEVDVRIIGIDMERQRVSLSMLPYSEDSAGYSGMDSGSGARDSAAPGSPAPRRDPAARAQSAGGTSTAPRRPRRDRDEGPAFPSTSSVKGDRAVIDDEEEAPTLFEHAWLSAQRHAAAKGVAVPADMA